MRRFRLLVLTIIITAASSFTALAGQWIKDNKGWWYKYNKGWWPAAKWQEIDGKWYYFARFGEGRSTGEMYQSETTPDGYKVDSNGVFIN